MINLKAGEKRNISFPLDIDQDLLKYLNNQKNLSGTLIRLAREGLLFGHILKNLEMRIQILENERTGVKVNIEVEDEDVMVLLKNAKKSKPLDSDVEDDVF